MTHVTLRILIFFSMEGAARTEVSGSLFGTADIQFLGRMARIYHEEHEGHTGRWKSLRRLLGALRVLNQ